MIKVKKTIQGPAGPYDVWLTGEGTWHTVATEAKSFKTHKAAEKFCKKHGIKIEQKP